MVQLSFAAGPIYRDTVPNGANHECVDYISHSPRRQDMFRVRHGYQETSAFCYKLAIVVLEREMPIHNESEILDGATFANNC